MMSFMVDQRARKTELLLDGKSYPMTEKDLLMMQAAIIASLLRLNASRLNGDILIAGSRDDARNIHPVQFFVGAAECHPQ